MATYVTDAEVTEELQGVLQQPDGLTGTYWSILIPTANRRAYRELIQRLLSRGYSKTQIDTWDARTDYQL